jgi:4-amino-4-deoxy-L-arabinose transferase-like glycosyltransferase
MTAWMIRLSTSLFGNNLLAIRLPAVLVHLALLYKLSTLSANKTVLTLLLLSPLSIFGAVLMTPDIPLVLFWFVYFLWASGINSRFSSWSDDPISRVYRQKPVPMSDWIIGGICLGLGLLSKYTMGLAPICLLFLLLGNYRIQAWYQGFLAHGFTALLIFVPVLIFNVHYDFSPLFFQWEHTRHSVPFSFLFSYLGSQILLVGALPFLLLPWILVNYRSLVRIPSYRTQICFFLFPLIFFTYKSTHHFLEANWGLVSYLSFWPLSSYFVLHNSFRFFVWAIIFLAFIVPITVSLALLIHLFRPLPWIGIAQDRLAKMRGQNALVQRFAETQKEFRQFPIFLPNYQWTSYFKFYGFSSANQLSGTGRQSHFTLVPTDPCTNERVLFFNQSGERLPQALECFKHKRALIALPLMIRDHISSHWELSLLSKTEAAK